MRGSLRDGDRRLPLRLLPVEDLDLDLLEILLVMRFAPAQGIAQMFATLSLL